MNLSAFLRTYSGPPATGTRALYGAWLDAGGDAYGAREFGRQIAALGFVRRRHGDFPALGHPIEYRVALAWLYARIWPAAGREATVRARIANPRNRVNAPLRGAAGFGPKATDLYDAYQKFAAGKPRADGIGQIDYDYFLAMLREHVPGLRTGHGGKVYLPDTVSLRPRRSIVANYDESGPARLAQRIAQQNDWQMRCRHRHWTFLNGRRQRLTCGRYVDHGGEHESAGGFAWHSTRARAS